MKLRFRGIYEALEDFEVPAFHSVCTVRGHRDKRPYSMNIVYVLHS